MKIASFNVQRFGLKKVSDPFVLSTLVKIVSRYDIMLILEVTDVSGDSVDLFLKELNAANTVHHYTLKISTRLGRTRYKEQFLFLYRDDLVDLVDTYQYEDNQVDDHDAFAREPYILRFMCSHTVLKDLVLIPVHTKPDDSVKELDELYEVFQMVHKKWNTDNVMILGDFNADGTYVSDFNQIRIRSDKNFHWLIGDDVDTTANTGNEHTYDRIVVYGDDMLAAVVPGSAQPFNFHTEYNLSERKALKVSDHYPVEVELRWEPHGPIGWNMGPPNGPMANPRSFPPPHQHHHADHPATGTPEFELIPDSELPPYEPSFPIPPADHRYDPAAGTQRKQIPVPFDSGAGSSSSPYPTIRSDLRQYDPVTRGGPRMAYDSTVGGTLPQVFRGTRDDLPQPSPFQGNAVVIFPPRVEQLMVEVLGMQRDNMLLEREKLGLEIQMLKQRLARPDGE
ncbi:deoxyribonuclease-1-like [Engraulis encrasicolus]|uniref:deoxyribonuclease-1-like n=1 Tax=Engraulis encrasicolus TaxID=184585 RepID=UPI002FD3BB2E